MHHDLSVPQISRVILFSFLVLSASAVLRAEDEQSKPDVRFEVVSPGRGGTQRSQPISQGEVHRSLLINGTARLQETVPTDNLKLIVEVEEPGSVQTQFGLRTAAVSEVEQRLLAVGRVADRIVQLENAWRSARQLPTLDAESIVRHRYSLVLTGAAVTVSRDVAASLAGLPDVRRVWPDTQKKALLDKSIPLINANRVWSDLQVTGKGVVVAVVDTGIDYRHADLGGCLGPECRVKAGYNFTSTSQAKNPIDDNGHGTHVAGTIAANGVMKGVAPDAKLLAVKVLDKDGLGLTSQIIAGIEWAVSQGADVMNLSLGGQGSPDDPNSQAVDNAIDLGCVVVVAAGNEGPDYDTLGSPGVARKVLTVGASDDNDVIASFSSRGPSSIYQVKPEILAPGVAIKSTVPKGTCDMCDASGFAEASGTSMATPHVAGAAALLLERHPDWTHQQIKDALIQTSVDLHLNPFQQGAGRLDIYAATTAPVLISGPNGALVNCGLDDLTSPVWSRSYALTITNLGTTAQSCQLSVEGQLPTGISAALSAGSISLAPSETKTLTFSLTVDNNVAPHAAKEPFDYTGSIVADLGGRRSHTPFVIVKSPVLAMDFNDDPEAYWVVVHKGLYSKLYITGGYPLTVSVPPGELNVVTGFTDFSTFVVREGVSVEQRTELEIRKDQAIHKVRQARTYYNGLSSGWYAIPMLVAGLRTKGPGFEFRIILPAEITEWQFSNVSSAYVFESSLMEYGLPHENRTHLFHMCLSDGINQSMTVKNARADLKSVEIRHGAGAGLDNLVLTGGLHFRDGEGILLISPPLKAPITEQFHLLAEPSPDYGLGYLQTQIFSGSYAASKLIYRGPFLRAAAAPLRLNAYLDGEYAVPLFSTTADFLPMGDGPYVWSARFENKKQEIALTPLLGEFVWPFVGQTGETRNQTGYAYELWQGTKKLKSGNIPGTVLPLGPVKFSLLNLTPGSYVFKAKTNIKELGTTGQGDLTATMNTEATDPDPPYLLGFQLLTGQAASGRIPAEGAEVRFRAGDNQGISQATLSYDIGGGWKTATVQMLGPDEYSAAIPGPSALASLKLEIKDNSQNSITYQTSAAKRFVDLGLTVSRTGDFKINTKPVFSLKLCNYGTEPIAPPVVVSMNLPYGLKYIGFSGTGWNCSVNGQKVGCTFYAPIQIGDLDTSVRVTVQVTNTVSQYASHAALQCAGDMNSENNALTDYMVMENWVASGLSAENLYSLVVHPSDRNTMYAGTARGLFKTTDRGTNWVMAVIGQEVRVRSIVVDPATPATLYMGTEGQGVYKSTDAGDSWTKTNTGLGNLTVYTLIIDPKTPKVLYAGTGAGVFKTSNGGTGWSASSTGLTNTKVSALAIHPQDSKTLFAGTAIGICKSQDAGVGWKAVFAGGSSYIVNGIVFDPTNLTIMYAATAKGVYKSVDGGNNWEVRNLGLNKVDIKCVLVDSNDPQVVYIGIAGAGIYRSLDGAASWSSFGLGATTATVTCLVFNDSIIASTTRGMFGLSLSADLAVAVANSGHFMSGSYARFTLRVTNAGLGASKGAITVVDTLPTSFEFVSASGPGWTCSAAGKNVQCTRTEPISPGAETDIGFLVALSEGTFGGVSNSATVQNSSDSNGTNNSCTEGFSVVAGTPVWFPFYQGDQSSFTGFALVNPGSSPANLDFFAYGKDGVLQALPDNPSSRSLEPNKQLAELGNELFHATGDAKQAGWVKLVSDSQITGFFLFGSGAKVDGSVVFTQKSKVLYFTRVFEGPKSYRNQAATTKLSLVNPNRTPAVLKLTLFNQSSAAVSSVNVTIPGYGCVYDSIPALFATPVTLSGGYVKVECTQGDGVVGFELVQLQDRDTLIGLNAAITPGKDLYSAQLAEVPGLYTSVKIINTGQTLSTVVLEAIGDDGKPLGAPYTVDLVPGASLEKDAGEIFGWKAGQSHVGSLKIQGSTQNLVGDVVFGDTAFVSAAAMPLQTTQLRRAVFSQVANGMGLFTGLAFYNPADDTASVKVQVFSPEGEMTGEANLDIPSGGRMSQLLSELVPSTQNQIRGYVLVTSSKLLIAQQLFGDGNFLAAVPPSVLQ